VVSTVLSQPIDKLANTKTSSSVLKLN